MSDDGLAYGFYRAIWPREADDARLNALPIGAELLWHKLKVVADDFGSVIADPTWIRVNVFRRRSEVGDAEVAEWLAGLDRAGFLLPYVVEGERYYRLSGFARQPRRRNGKPIRRYPAPPDESQQDAPGRTGIPSDQSGCTLDAPRTHLGCTLDSPTESRKQKAENREQKAKSFIFDEACVAPQSDAPPATPASEALLTFATKGRPKSWSLTREQVGQWATAFPGIDILAECRRAEAWLAANSERRKTAKGMPNFLYRWISRANDRRAPTGSRMPTQFGSPTGTLEERKAAIKQLIQQNGEATP